MSTKTNQKGIIKMKKDTQKLIKKWEKRLKKEGLGLIEQGNRLFPDIVCREIDRNPYGLDEFYDRASYFELMQDFYWTIYKKHNTILDLYVQGYCAKEISEMYCKNKNKTRVANRILKFRRAFQKHCKCL